MSALTVALCLKLAVLFYFYRVWAPVAALFRLLFVFFGLCLDKCLTFVPAATAMFSKSCSRLIKIRGCSIVSRLFCSCVVELAV